MTAFGYGRESSKSLPLCLWYRPSIYTVFYSITYVDIMAYTSEYPDFEHRSLKKRSLF